jgi:amidohydrolase
MDKVEARILARIDAAQEQIIGFARDIFAHGELGFQEVRTSQSFADALAGLGFQPETGLALTGVKARLNPEKACTTTLALIGELDALRIPESPVYNPETQGAHCCGHHAQLAGVLGAAIALSDPEVAAALDGQVVFFATPSEEYGELAFKNQLMADGKIVYGGGKCELIRTGAFDEIDLCLAHHIGFEGIQLGSGSGNGFLSKIIRYTGRAAHAASAPDKGINALSAASLGLQALALNRETFRDEDCVRVHPILTEGGDLVNVVPSRAVIEALVRAKTLDAIVDAAQKTDRAFLAGAMAMGAQCRIETAPGYLPYLAQAVPDELFEAAQLAASGRPVQELPLSRHSGGSTDLGDVQHLMPVLSFRTGGAVGSGLHAADFQIQDEEEAYLITAKIFALSAYRLLRNQAALARDVVGSYQPKFRNKSEYCAFWDALRGETVFPQK